MNDTGTTATEKAPSTRLVGWSVRQKISLGFGGLILLMALGIGLTLYKLEEIKAVTNSVIKERQPTATLFQKLNHDLSLATSLLNGYLLTGETDLRDEYNSTQQQLQNRLGQAQLLANTENSGLDVEQLQHAKKLLSQFTDYADQLFDLRDRDANNRGMILAQETLNPPAIVFLGNINALLESEDVDSNNPKILAAYKALQDLRYSWVQMMNSLRMYVITQDRDQRINFDTFKNHTGELLTKLTKMDVEIGFGELEALTEIRNTYVANIKPVFDIFESGNWRADSFLIKSEVRPILNELRQIFEHTADAQLNAAIESGQVLTDAQKQIVFTTLVILAVGLLLGGLLAIRITNGIVPPIQHLMLAAKNVADGDLNAEVVVTTQDEIGKLGISFNAMTNHLRSASMKEQQMLDELQNLNQDLESRVEKRTKALEQSEIRIRAILDNIGEGIIVLDEKGMIESMNPAAEKIFDIKKEDALGLNATLLIADNALDKLVELDHYDDEIHGVFKNSSDQQPIEYQGLRSNGDTFPLELVVSVLNVGNKRLRVCILRDVTARKETESSLANAQNQLVDAAHKSGMADMATGVLHNIGNILNSVNLSGEEIKRISSASKISGLNKANDLLQAQENIGEFLANDPRGQKLPGYFIKMGKVLNDEISEIQQESKELIKKTTMMKEVISTQQAYAKSGFHSEQLNLTQLIEDALKIQEASLKKWGVKLDKKLADTPDCTGQKSKLLQVITNLVKNAKEAMNDNDQFNRPKEMFIETGMVNDQAVYLTIKDNGCGISKDQLTKIFNHGFTTKEAGHGFGLHSSANAMTEMKGALKVDSEGVQKGATFTVTIPVSKAA